jgi:hypothetical protein
MILATAAARLAAAERPAVAVSATAFVPLVAPTFAAFATGTVDLATDRREIAPFALAVTVLVELLAPVALAVAAALVAVDLVADALVAAVLVADALVADALVADALVADAFAVAALGAVAFVAAAFVAVVLVAAALVGAGAAFLAALRPLVFKVAL